MAPPKKQPVTSRFSGALEPEHFDLLARDPQAWLSCGVDLLRSARAVTRQIIVDNKWDATSGDPGPKSDVLSSGHPRMIKPLLLLSALGAELGFKAVIVFRLPPLPTQGSGRIDRNLMLGHDLKRLSGNAGIRATTPLEEQAIHDGREIIEWVSKYPVRLEGGPTCVAYSTDLREPYEQLFLRCVERVAREQHKRTPRLHAIPVGEWVTRERRRFEHAMTGISAPRASEESVLDMRGGR